MFLSLCVQDTPLNELLRILSTSQHCRVFESQHILLWSFWWSSGQSGIMLLLKFQFSVDLWTEIVYLSFHDIVRHKDITENSMHRDICCFLLSTAEAWFVYCRELWNESQYLITLLIESYEGMVGLLIGWLMKFRMLYCRSFVHHFRVAILL